MPGTRLMRRLVGAVTIGAFALMIGAACGASPGHTGPAGQLSFQVTLINGDALIGEPIHMFAPGESFGCCRVMPLEWRDVVVTGFNEGQKVTFSVGRLQKVLKSVQCTARNDNNKVVKWVPSSIGSDSGSLVCQTGW